MRRGTDKGQRKPITSSGLRKVFETTCKTAGIRDFRIHDFRHTFGTQLLRETRNLALVQKALDHSDIASTLRYVHVLDDEVAEGMDLLGKYRSYPGAQNLLATQRLKKA